MRSFFLSNSCPTVAKLQNDAYSYSVTKKKFDGVCQFKYRSGHQMIPIVPHPVAMTLGRTFFPVPDKKHTPFVRGFYRFPCIVPVISNYFRHERPSRIIHDVS
jgi:hypothetical protein